MWDRIWRVLVGVLVCFGVGESYRAVVPDVTPAPPTLPAEEPFADVEFGQRWYDGAQYGYRRGLVHGMSETEFGGELPATRAMAVTMIWRMAEEPLVLGTSGFSDVEMESWYAPAVMWAETWGLVQGFGDGSFRPQEELTWGQLELMLERYVGQERVEVFRAAVSPRDGGAGRGLKRGELAETLMEVCEERGAREDA